VVKRLLEGWRIGENRGETAGWPLSPALAARGVKLALQENKWRARFGIDSVHDL
jgi:hypothetical protein